MDMLCKLIGIIFVVFGIVGVILPLLPTTPFILLAAACFAKSSQALHQRLLSSRLFGPSIRDWEKNRCIASSTKILAIFMIVGIGGSSVVFLLPEVWMKMVAAVFIIIGLMTVSMLKVCRES